MRRLTILMGVLVGLALGVMPAFGGKTPLTAAITSGPSATSGPTVTFSFTSNYPGATFQCRLDGSTWVACTSPTTYTGLRTGSHTFAVHALYQGKKSPEASRSWAVDATPPPAPTIGSAPSGTTASTQAAIAFSDTEAGATFVCSLDQAPSSPCTSPASYQGLGDGAHTFAVRARDAVGNLSAAATDSWTVDATPPPAPTIDSGPASSTTTTYATFSFSDTESSSVFACSLDSAVASACTSPTQYTNLSVGDHTFSVVAKDAVGNTSGTVTYTWTVQAPTNYLTNGSFESSTAGWTSWNGTVSLASDGTVGTHAAKVSVNAGATAYSFYPTTRPITTTTSGHAYAATGWIRSDTPGKTVCLYIREFSSTGAQTDHSSCTKTTTAWAHFPENDYTTAGSGGQLTVFVQESGAAAGDSFEVDGLSLTDFVAPPPPPPAPQSPSNYLTNGSFEGSTTGWTSWNGAVSLANDGKVGANAAKVALNAGATAFSFYPSSRPITSTTSGHAYAATGWIRSDTPGRIVCLYIREFDSTGAKIADHTTCATTSTTWTQFAENDYTTAQSGGQLTVFVQESTASAGDSFEVDGLQLTDYAPPPPSNDPVILAAGDAACAPSDPDYKNGAGSGTRCMAGATANLMASISGVTAFLPLGDEQYQCGELTNFQTSYAPTWGRFDPIAHPVPGNHEYGDDAQGCTPSMAPGYYSYFGTKAGDPMKGYYSFNIGSWHLIALNSDCRAVGGCGVGSPEETWLRNDLAANPVQCTLAYWHIPRWSAGQMGDNTNYSIWWTDLYNAHVDLVLAGHDHTYQRFVPMNPSGAADPNGITQMIVGTGGEEMMSTMTARSTLVTANTNTFGVAKISLGASGWSGSFLPVAGGSFSDTFSGTCH